MQGRTSESREKVLSFGRQFANLLMSQGRQGEDPCLDPGGVPRSLGPGDGTVPGCPLQEASELADRRRPGDSVGERSKEYSFLEYGAIRDHRGSRHPPMGRDNTQRYGS